MSSKSVRISVFAALLVAVLFVAVVPAHAAPLADTKPACTVNDGFFKRLFGLCVDLDQKAPVSQPAVVTIDTAKWQQALDNAEAALRAASNGNHDPVDNSNPVRDLAWKTYCNSEGQPHYTVTGEPVCK
jgi:hypothetical protein